MLCSELTRHKCAFLWRDVVRIEKDDLVTDPFTVNVMPGSKAESH